MSSGDVLDNIEFDRSTIGVNVPVGSHRVTKDEIMAYAKALGETNPLYLDEEAAKAGPYGTIIAPPGFYHSIRLNQMPDIKLKFGDRNSGFIGGQSIEVLRIRSAIETEVVVGLSHSAPQREAARTACASPVPPEPTHDRPHCPIHGSATGSR